MPFARPAPSSSPAARRLAATGLASLALIGLPAVAAQAHVSVKADSTSAGSFSQITFRVPNESDTAGTVKVSVELPTETPFRFVSVKPIPGWAIDAKATPLAEPVEAEGTTLTKAVQTVTWTAEKGNQINSGEYQEFSISAGPLPAAGDLPLPATQTYSDGEVVTWDQPTPASGEEPEHPAPVVAVVAAEAQAEGEAGAEASQAAPAPVEETAAATAGGSDPTARGLAGAALVVGLAAGALGALGLRRRTP